MPGCWKGNERAGAEGSAESRARAGERVPPPCHCPVPWPGLGHLWGRSESSPGLALVWAWPGILHLSLEHLCPPEPGMNLGRGPLCYSTGKDLLAPKMHLQVSQRLAPTPPGRILTSYPVIHGNPRETHRDSSLQDTHHSDECPPFSPMQDLDANGGGGSRGSPAPALSRPRSPRPQPGTRGRGHAWPAQRVSTGSAQPRWGALTSVTNTPAPAKAGLPGQAEN